jgi:hypothetical protein
MPQAISQSLKAEDRKDGHYLRRLLFELGLAMIICLGWGLGASAKSDLSLNVSDITFSNNEPLAGEKVRIFARVFNVGDQDLYGFVIFSTNNKEIGDPQPVSVKTGTYDDVFIDWAFQSGNHNIEARLAVADEDNTNNLAVKDNYLVDSDSDGDGIGNSQDLDNDNDGLAKEVEEELGTDPLDPDSDGDEVNDSQDTFPLDVTEWEDADSDGLGNNIDTDDDNDSLSDEEELILGTNPQKTDTDGDLIPDKTEVKIGFLEPNRNEWKMAGLGLASILSAIKSQVAENNIVVGRLFAAFGYLSILWFILRYRRQRKG